MFKQRNLAFNLIHCYTMQMGQDEEFLHDEFTQEQFASLRKTLEKHIRQSVPKDIKTLECLSWCNAVEEALYNEDEPIVLPLGIQIYRCTNHSASDPHHWMEVEFSQENNQVKTFLWDDTQQKLKGTSFIEKKKQPTLWNDYFNEHNERVQLYPDFQAA